MKTILQIAFSLLITLLLAEAGLRALNPHRKFFAIETIRYYRELRTPPTTQDPFPLHKANTKANIMGVDIETDSLGLRRTKEKKRTDKNILIIGDSIALGWGNSIKNTFFAKIERKLKSIYDADVAVSSAGLLNTNTEYHFTALKKLYSKTKPEAVILVYYPTQIIEENRVPNIWEQNLYTVHILKRAVSGLINDINKVDTAHVFQKIANTESVEWKNHLQQLKRMKDYLSERNIPFHIVMAPNLQNLSQDTPIYSSYKKIQNSLVNENFSVSNGVFKILQSYTGKEKSLWVANDDYHGNEKFQEALAQNILEFIKENKKFRESILGKDLN